MDAFETRTMLAALEQAYPARGLLLDLFFPRVETSNTAVVDIDIFRGKRRLAPFVNPRMQGKLVERSGYTTRTYRPPYIKPKMQFSAEDLLKREMGMTVYQGGKTPAERAAEMLGRDLAELRDMVVRREEWMAAQALTTGKIPVIGDGVNDEIDFGFATSHKVTLTGGNRWDQSGTKPLTNLRTWRSLVAQDSGLVPDVVVGGADAIEAFLGNAEVQKFMLTNQQPNVVGQINVGDLQATGATYISTLWQGGLKIFQYDEWYIDPADNETVRPMIPADTIIMGSTKARAVRHYGLIQDLEAGDFAVPFFPKVWLEKDPSVRWVMVQSAPLVVPHQIDAFLWAKVI